MRVIAWMTMALVASPVLAQDAADAVFQKLQAEFNQALSEARARGERIGLKEVAAPFFPKFDEAAKKYRGTDDAIPFLSWILINYRDDEVKVNAAIEEVLDHHLESQALVQMATIFASLASTVGEQRYAELERRLIEAGHPEVKAAMLFFNASSASVDRNPSEEAKEAATEKLRQAAELGGEYGDFAAGMLFERERLKIGMQAPDIVGEDLDGVEFKLSDYRGKVVVLDFWGDW